MVKKTDLTVIEGSSGGGLVEGRIPKGLELVLRINALSKLTPQAKSATVILAVAALSEDGLEQARRTIERQRALLVQLEGDENWGRMFDRYHTNLRAIERARDQPFQSEPAMLWIKQLVGSFPAFPDDSTEYGPMLMAHLQVANISPAVLADCVFQATRIFDRRPSIHQFLAWVERRRAAYWSSQYGMTGIVGEAFAAAQDLLGALLANERKLALFQALPAGAAEAVVHDIEFLEGCCKRLDLWPEDERELIESLERLALENHASGDVARLAADIRNSPEEEIFGCIKRAFDDCGYAPNCVCPGYLGGGFWESDRAPESTNWSSDEVAARRRAATRED